MSKLHENLQIGWIKTNPSHPFHFVSCKMVIQKNNVFQLIDRVIAITKNYIYIYYYKQQDSNAQYQALNKSKSQPIPLEVLQSPQAKIQLKESYSWTYFTQNDPSMIKYIQQILPSYTSNISKDLSLFLIKNNEDFQVFNLFLQNQQLAKQLCSALDRTQIMKKMDKFIKYSEGEWNQKIINMLCDAKKGLLVFDPEDFGFGYRTSYSLISQQKQIKFVIDCLKPILKDLPQQVELKVQLKFKIIDQESGQYAYQFLSINGCQKRLTELSLKNCQLIEEQFQSFMLKTDLLTKKIHLKFSQLYNLDLSLNKLTDNIFNSLDKLLQKNIFPQLYKLNLSKNYLTLSSNSNFMLINFLSKLNYQLDLNLAQNRIADCQFIKKYLINADRKGTLPIEYLNLQNNKIKQNEKQKLLDQYLKRKEQDSKFTLILNLGEVTHFKASQIKYLKMLSNYFAQSAFPEAQSSSFVINQKNDIVPMIFTRDASNLGHSNSRVSLISNPSSANLNLSNQKLINQLFQSLAKLYVLQDYKQISLYRKQMQKNGITQKILISSLPKEVQQKKKQQKRLAQQMKRISNFLINQNKINEKLQQFVGLIRRRGIQGKGSEFLVYLKYKRDLLIQSYLKNKQSFQQNHPQLEILEKKMKSYSKVFKDQNQRVDSFLETDYKNLIDETYNTLYERLMYTKSIGIDISKFNQKTYNRLKYLLLSDQSMKKNNVIQPILETILLQLKLPLVRYLRFCKEINLKQNFQTTKIKIKQRITKFQPIIIKNKVQILSKFDILNYQFNFSVDKEKISASPQILSRFSYNETKYNEIIGFIQIVNNFLVFLYYTPQQISEQTLTYLVYIIEFLHNLSKDTKQQKQFSTLLIEQMYLHMISYEGNTKLSRGILAGIFEYLTSRLYCSQSIQKYILAFLIKNQPIDVENVKLNIRNNFNVQSNTLNLGNKIIRPDWLLPSPLLSSSLLNHLMIDIQIYYNSNQPIIMQFCQSMTVNQIWIQMNQKKFKNGNFQEQMFEKFGISKQQIPYFWIYQQQSYHKMKYFKPLQSELYLGQLICLNKLDSIHLRRAVFTEKYHNRKVLKYQMKEQQLLYLYFEIKQRLFQSLSLISQSSDLQPYQYESQVSKDYFLNILAQVLFIQLSIEQKLHLTQLFSPQYKSNFSTQQFQDLYNQQKNNILKGIIHKINQEYRINFKILNMDEKFKVSELIKEKQRDKNTIASKSIGQKINNFIQKIGDYGYTQTLIEEDQILVINNRMLWIGSIVHHTNQVGQVIYSYTQLKQTIQLKSVINVQIRSLSQKNSQMNFIQIKVNDKNQKNNFFAYQTIQIKGRSNFIIHVHYILKAIAKNKLQWENKLLYNCQHTGIGTEARKNISKKYLQDNIENGESNEIHLETKKLIKGVYWIQNIFYDEIFLIRNKQNRPSIERSHIQQKRQAKALKNQKKEKSFNRQSTQQNNKNADLKRQQNQLQSQYSLIQKQIQQETRKRESEQGIKVQIDPNHTQIQEIINQALNQQKQKSLQNQNNTQTVVTNKRRSSRKEAPRRRSSRQK